MTISALLCNNAWATFKREPIIVTLVLNSINHGALLPFETIHYGTHFPLYRKRFSWPSRKSLSSSNMTCMLTVLFLSQCGLSSSVWLPGRLQVQYHHHQYLQHSKNMCCLSWHTILKYSWHILAFQIYPVLPPMFQKWIIHFRFFFFHLFNVFSFPG